LAANTARKILHRISFTASVTLILRNVFAITPWPAGYLAPLMLESIFLITMTMSAGYVSHLLKNAFFNINSLQPRSMWENSGVVSLLAVLGIVVGTVLVGVTGKYRYCSIIW